MRIPLGDARAAPDRIDPTLRRRLERGVHRVVFTGGPRTGKSFIAEASAALFGGTVRHTDDLVGKLGWNESIAEVARWFDDTSAPWIIEGVTAVRALRAWMFTHPGRSRPADLVVWCSVPKVVQTPGQRAMAAGCETVWRQVARDLANRGVPIESG